MAKRRSKTLTPRSTSKTRKSRKARKSRSRPAEVRRRMPHYGGPAEWLLPMMEETFSRLGPKDKIDAIPDVSPGRSMRGARAPRGAKAKRAQEKPGAFRSTYQAGKGEAVLAQLPRTFWEKRFSQFHSRRVEHVRRVAALRAGPPGAPGMPAIPGTNNWTPLGPSIVAHAQTGNRGPITGRTGGIAIANDGLHMYVSTADGGVWRSDDAGRHWMSTMDNFDLNPTNFASTSLACGAIAIDPANPNRVYVGTGEGDTDAIFANRIVNALPAYRGIGPIRSDDGGVNWVTEPSSPSLAGFAFFQIAVDPGDPNHCVAATTNGLYERVPAGGGGFQWTRRRTPRHSSVVVSRVGTTTTWFAAEFGGLVYKSTNGTTWAAVGTGFPTVIGRVALGVQRDNPNVLYAVVIATTGALNSVRRLDGVAGAWANVASPPPFLPGGQGDYDVCISVDPNNANRIYLGGDYFNDGAIYPGSIWRCIVSPSGAAYTMATTSIGQNAHADVHALAHSPGDSNTLWTGTDGGLFVNTNPTGAGSFEPRQTGLGTLCTNFLAQHPTEPAVIYVGLQDNGTAKYTGEEVWRHVLFADGGYCVVNWNDPFRVMLFANGNVFRATDGGLDWSSWSVVTPPSSQWVVMAAPLVGTPYNPAVPAEANIVAYGAGTAANTIVYISSNFGTSWPNQVTLPAGSGRVFSMVFASASRLYAGTTNGRVFRIDNVGGTWTATRIDNAAGGALPLAGLVSDIGIDWSDATLNSIYLCFGGVGDFRHVWRFNGTAWQARSGTSGSGTELLDVEHNAIQFDRVTNRVYVGADIGAWESADGGVTWNPLSNGLPDAPVYDLQIHPTARLLRASLHGRGIWEWKLDLPVQPNVELYVRDTMLDTGRGVNTDGRNDPSIFPTAPVFHYLSPNIKVDVPTPAGYQTPTNAIDFYTFNEVIHDGSGGVATNVPPPTVHNRVYVEVHNRGRVDALNVRVMAAITNAATGLGLPAGYTANVVAGTPLPGPKWITLGVQMVPIIRAGLPAIVPFDLPSTSLPMPSSLPGDSHFCMVAFVHAAQDPFTSSVGNVDSLTLADRKVGQKNLHIVQFVGTPPPASSTGMWAMLYVSGVHFRERSKFTLMVDGRNFPGTIQVALPPPLGPQGADNVKGFRAGTASAVSRWLTQYGPVATRLYNELKYPAAQYKALVAAMAAVKGQTPWVLAARTAGEFRGLTIGPKDEHAVFLRIDLPENTRAGSAFEFDVTQRHPDSGALLGGSRYRVVVNKKP